MQIINYWPRGALAIKHELEQTLILHISAPFSSEAQGRRFWKASYTKLVYIQKNDDFPIFNELGASLQQEIQNALHLFEYREIVFDDHILSLTITCDEGGGIYLLYPSKHLLIKQLTEQGY